MRSKSFEYDVALSFAGENRDYVEEVAKMLKKRKIKVFYDLFEEANLWGKNLYEYLSEIYQNKAYYTVIFISKFYNKKLWTNHERVAMQARAFKEHREYILPARFDDTEIPGILNTVGYINLVDRTPVELAGLIDAKVKREGRTIPETVQSQEGLGNKKPFVFGIKICSIQGHPIAQAKVVLMAKNHTYLEGCTDENGMAYFVIKNKKIFSVLIAHSKYKGCYFPEINASKDIRILMQKTSGTGSVILKKSGEIPGILGKIKPIKKRNKKLVLFADNLAIDGGVEQPFNFELNSAVTVEDNQGKVLHLVFRFFQGSIILLDFYKTKTQT